MSGRKFGRLQEVETGHLVATQVELADTAWKRSVGLLGRHKLPANGGLWIAPCNGIHTLGMRFVLDIVFLDRDGRALRLAPHVRPWRICGPVRGARVVIELPAGTITRCALKTNRHYTLTPD